MECKGCGQEFIPVPNNGRAGGLKGPRLYCSPECRNRSLQAAYKLKHPEKSQEHHENDYLKHREERIRNQTAYKRSGLEISNEHQRAYSRVRYAIKIGKIIKPESCEICNKVPKRLEAHHYKGYDYPLEVIWLCSSCHKKVELMT